MAKSLRLRRRVRLIVTESRLGPAMMGLFRSTVLLPALIVNRLVCSPVAPGQGFGTSLDSDPAEAIEGLQEHWQVRSPHTAVFGRLKFSKPISTLSRLITDV